MANQKLRAQSLFQNLSADHETKNDLWITQCIYPGKRYGFFVEAGAAGGKFGSSCYVLESRLGWTGICIEPHSEFFRQLVENRPNSICENICLSDQSGEVVFMEGCDDLSSPYLSGIKSNLKQFKHHSENILDHGKEIIKASVTLDVLLRKHNAPKIIDYAAFDIEGSEFEILKKFPFDEFQFSALSLECDWHIWEPITNLFSSNNYREVKNPFNMDKSWERYWLHESLT